MIKEQIFAGKNNTFSLQLFRGEVAVNLLSITGYRLVLSEDLEFTDDAYFIEKGDGTEGIVEINIGPQLGDADKGQYTAYLVTFDPINTAGVVWPKFKLKVG